MFNLVSEITELCTYFSYKRNESFPGCLLTKDVLLLF